MKGDPMVTKSEPLMRPSVAYAAIAVVWLITRAYSISQAIPWQYWEIWEAHKLLDYGFLARQGAIINVHFMTGLLDAPEKFNYVNHPYPILWIFTLFYSLFGEWGALLMGSALGLVSSLAVYPALKIRFTPREALWGTILFMLAPSTILMDVNPNIVALGAIGWPFLMISLAELEKGVTYRRAFILTGLVFVLGQISWFTYTLSAAIFGVLIIQIWTAKLSGISWRKPAALSLVIGGVATMAVLLFQVYFYTFDLSEVLAYARGQSSAVETVSPFMMVFGIVMRIILSIGPALLLGGALGAVILIKRPALHWMEFTALLYLLIFAGCALLLPRFFFREVTMYEYLAFPFTVMTLGAIQAIRTKLFVYSLAFISLLGLAYPIYQASIPIVSETARNLAAVIRSNTESKEILATNLNAQKFPFATWDVGSRGHSAMLADRMIRWGIDSRTALENIPNDFKTEQIDVTYIFCDGLPPPEELRDILFTQTPVKTIRVELPLEPPSSATRVRSLYWKLVGKHQVAPMGESESPTFNLSFYRFTLKAPQK